MGEEIRLKSVVLLLLCVFEKHNFQSPYAKHQFLFTALYWKNPPVLLSHDSAIIFVSEDVNKDCIHSVPAVVK